MTAILLVSGSTRSASSNTAALPTIHALTVDGVSTTLYEGWAGLPQSARPKAGPLSAEVHDLPHRPCAR